MRSISATHIAMLFLLLTLSAAAANPFSPLPPAGTPSEEGTSDTAVRPPNRAAVIEEPETAAGNVHVKPPPTSTPTPPTATLQAPPTLSGDWTAAPQRESRRLVETTTPLQRPDPAAWSDHATPPTSTPTPDASAAIIPEPTTLSVEVVGAPSAAGVDRETRLLVRMPAAGASLDSLLRAMAHAIGAIPLLETENNRVVTLQVAHPTPFEQLWTPLLALYGLEAEWLPGNVVVVRPQTPPTIAATPPVQLQQRLYPLQHVAATPLSVALSALLQGATALRVEPIDHAGLLAITTDDLNHRRAQEFITLLDRPPTRMAVHLMLVEVEEQAHQSAGFNASLGLNQTLRIEVESAGSINLALGSGGSPAGNLSFRALERSGRISRVEEVTLMLEAGVATELFFGGQIAERARSDEETALTIPYGLTVLLEGAHRSASGEVVLNVELTLEELLSRQELHRSRRSLSTQARLASGETALLAEIRGMHHQTQQSSPLRLSGGAGSGPSGSSDHELRERRWLLFASATPIDTNAAPFPESKLAWDVLD